jgi:hypothetical protein
MTLHPPPPTFEHSEYTREVIDHMYDVCEALSEYVLAGGVVRIESTREGAPLTIAFTLADGDQYHSLLRARMAGAHQIRVTAGTELSLQSYVEARAARDWMGEFISRGKAVLPEDS